MELRKLLEIQVILFSGTECDRPQVMCDLHATCITNTTGSYCVCETGYFGNGTHCEGKTKFVPSITGQSMQ